MASYSISTLDKAAFEGTGADTQYTFTITRSGDLSLAGSVAWHLVDGPPAPVTAADFAVGTLLKGTAVFAPGEAIVQVVVSVVGDADPEPNEGFGIEIFNPSAGDTIDSYVAFAVIRDDDAQHILGTARNDTLNNSGFTRGTVTDVSQGGNDTVTGGAFDDTVLFGAAFTANDRFDGAAGYDRIVLDGDYSKGITLVRNALVNVEEIDFVDGHNYRLTTVDPTVAGGATMVFDARSLSPLNSVNINGSAETNGFLYFIGGSGADTFKGGRAADTLIGGYGADRLDGFLGADRFVYEEALDSPVVTDGIGNIQASFADLISGFQVGLDKIDLTAFGLIGDQTAVLTRTNTSFTTNLDASGTGFFGSAGVAVEYASVNKVMTARVYVDVNGDGNLTTNDMMFQLTGAARGALKADSFSV